MTVALVGDIHGDFDGLHQIMHKLKGEVESVIQVGDLGVWPERISNWKPVKDMPLFFIEGNHEYYPMIPLDSLEDSVEIRDNLFYIPRGTVKSFPLGTDNTETEILFCGGGASVDKAMRQPGWNWFPEEVPRYKDIEKLENIAYADMMVTHAPPQSVVKKHFDQSEIFLRQWALPKGWIDPTTEVIQEVWDNLGNIPLVCGHMHRSVSEGNVRILNIGEVLIL